MDLQQFYKAAIDIAIDNDPRGRERLAKSLKKAQAQWNRAEEKERRFMDEVALENPFPDSRILNDAMAGKISKILVGIDIGTGELVLADRLNEKGAHIDLVMAHHPSGAGAARMYRVMEVQSDLFMEMGIPSGAAESLVEKRMREVQRRFLPSNHQQSVDAARLLGLSLICTHTMADNMVHTYLDRKLREKAPETLEEAIEVLMEEPEYQEAAQFGAGPIITLGSRDRRLGKVKLEMTGGTSGPKELFASMETAGVSTIIAMHLSEEHLAEARKHHMNVLISGHIASDTLGMNLLLDQLEIRNGKPFETVDASGFRRFRRS